MSKSSNDGQNLECDKHLRYVVQSGQSSIHGDTLYELQTQEAQSIAFHSGTGKAVLYTPGMSMEVLGEGLKVRNNNEISQLPAKIIKCKKGDIIIEAENGDITLRGRNINIDANGGDQGGQLLVKATRVADISVTGDIRLQGEKILIKADNTTNIISKGFLELKSGFTLSASFADESFGTMAQVLKAATTINPPTI